MEVQAQLKQLFPNGTRFSSSVRTWKLVPELPWDVFLAAAFLLDRMHLYADIRAPAGPATTTPPGTIFLPKPVGATLDTIAERWRAWSLKASDRAAIQNLWSAVWKTTSSRADLAAALLALLVVADEACVGVGTEPLGPTASPLNQILLYAFKGSGVGTSPATLSSLADPEIACVLPKSLCPEVGLTMRAVSRNLALLPPVNTSTVHWQFPHPMRATRKNRAFNLLLIPFPYEILPHTFITKYEDADARAGWFEVDPVWLRSSSPSGDRSRIRELVDYISKLILSAERSLGAVHGVALPELALTRSAYQRLRAAIRKRHSTIELLLSGVCESVKAPGLRGNFAIATVFYGTGVQQVTVEHAKHHRWRLDGSQIRRYGLGAALDPHLDWWESIEVGARPTIC